MKNKVVTREKWLKERKALLEKEKEFTRMRDQMTKEIRKLPWVKIEKDYRFEGQEGEESLKDLFGKHNQLAVYHFMLGPNWGDGCKSCSFWADNFQGIPIHLAQRNVSFVVISRAPFKEIKKFKKRMGWNFNWVSSFHSDFNFDFNVSFKREDIDAKKAFYNYSFTSEVADEMPGASFFYKKKNTLYHTYSTFSRGIDILNGAYNWLDLAPKGRDEDDLKFTMEWVRHHDKYGQ